MDPFKKIYILLPQQVLSFLTKLLVKLSHLKGMLQLIFVHDNYHLLEL